MDVFEEIKAEFKKISNNRVNELQVMVIPPKNISFVMKPVFYILKKKFLSWREIRVIIQRGSFVDKILNLSSKMLTQKEIKELEVYTKSDKWDLELVKLISDAAYVFSLWIEQLIVISKINREKKVIKLKLLELKKERAELTSNERVLMDKFKNIRIQEINILKLLKKHQEQIKKIIQRDIRRKKFLTRTKLLSRNDFQIEFSKIQMIDQSVECHLMKSKLVYDKSVQVNFQLDSELSISQNVLSKIDSLEYSFISPRGRSSQNDFFNKNSLALPSIKNDLHDHENTELDFFFSNKKLNAENQSGNYKEILDISNSVISNTFIDKSMNSENKRSKSPDKFSKNPVL